VAVRRLRIAPGSPRWTACDDAAGMDAEVLIARLSEATTAEELCGLLAEAFGRPALRILYWLPERGTYVDAAGRRTEAPPPTALVISRRGEPVAAVVAAGTDALPPGDPSLIAAAGLALENERLRVELRQRQQDQAAMLRVATLVAGLRPAEEVFAAIAEEVGRLLEARTSNVVRFDGDRGATVIGGWNEEGGRSVPVLTHFRIDADTAVARVMRTGEAQRVDDYASLPGAYAEWLRELIGVRSAVAAPLRLGSEIWGALTVSTIDDDPPFPADAEVRLGAFAGLASQAIANTESQRQLVVSRARIVEAADESRRRIERDLHDGAQQRLIGVALGLRMAGRQLDDPAAAATMLETCASELNLALQELRDLARGMNPPMLQERGLLAALQAIADRATVPVDLDVALTERLSPSFESALYFTASEAVTNVAKHAPGACVAIHLTHEDDLVVIEISDDGPGGADVRAGTGLRGLADRIDAIGGTLEVRSPAGAGTVVRAAVPSQVS
jgi:signal transduction histidine kinase